ncbi:hypothetical protein QJS10_CPA03g00845 [Acorus calamus]|uniref:Uncharacterized protein n=1 Tax=Acorus calamus TaxID=4465 RepID=A0AAV9F6F4_ACOCL|nr:hypothetical protein QJS10_CPA03g00845 [Acorus calamus]
MVWDHAKQVGAGSGLLGVFGTLVRFQLGCGSNEVVAAAATEAIKNLAQFPKGIVQVYILGDFGIASSIMVINGRLELLKNQDIDECENVLEALGQIGSCAANGGCGDDVGRRLIAGLSHPTVDVNHTRPSDAMDP